MNDEARAHEDTRNHEDTHNHEGTRNHGGTSNHEDNRHDVHEDGLKDDHGNAMLPETHAMRVASPLSPEAERVMSETIGCAIAVHRALGPGFIESIYRRAMRLELSSRRITYDYERPITVRYRGTDIPGQRVDLIVENLIVVELKCAVRLDAIHRAQLISYLRTTGLRGGLLINFRVPLLKSGLQRIVL